MLSPGTSSYLVEGVEDGAHMVQIAATDRAGNVGTAVRSFTIDTIHPTVTVFPTGEGIEITSTVVVEFSEPMNRSSVAVLISGATGTSSWNGNVLVVTPSSLLYNSEYTVLVVGEDLAGNSVSMSWSFSTIKVGSVEGCLTNQGGRAITNATVTLSNGVTTTTDDDGRYVFENVTIGAYTITFVKSGFETVCVDVTVNANETSELNTMATESVKSDTPSDNTPLIIVTALGVIAVIGIVFVAYRRRR
jgi:hypothetical protein